MIPKESQGKKHKDSKILFIYLFLTALCLSCSERAFSGCGERAFSGCGERAFSGCGEWAFSGCSEWVSLVAVNGFLWLP